MKKNSWLLGVAVLATFAVFVGCSDENLNTDPTSVADSRVNENLDGAVGVGNITNPNIPTNSSNSDVLSAKCVGHAPAIVLQEVYVGERDYVVIKNVSGALVDLRGYKLLTTGVSINTGGKGLKANTNTYVINTVIDPGKTLGIFVKDTFTATDKYKLHGLDEVDCNCAMRLANGPSPSGKGGNANPNAVSLYDKAGNLLDHMAIGPQNVDLPAGANFVPIPWPAGWNYCKQSFQRKAGTTPSCPNFDWQQWQVKPATRADASPNTCG